MPHSVFTGLTNQGNQELVLSGISHEPSVISVIDITVISIDHPGRSAEAHPIDTVRTPTHIADKLGETWETTAACDTGHGLFQRDEMVVVVGAATHSDTQHFQSPFRWTTFFKIPAPGATSEPELRISAPPAELQHH